MLCGWEGNRRSGVGLAMRHRLSGLSTYGLRALGREISSEHPAYTPAGVCDTLYPLDYAAIFLALMHSLPRQKLVHAFDVTISYTQMNTPSKWGHMM